MYVGLHWDLEYSYIEKFYFFFLSFNTLIINEATYNNSTHNATETEIYMYYFTKFRSFYFFFFVFFLLLRVRILFM